MKNVDLKEVDEEGLRKDEAEPEYVVYKGRWVVLLTIVMVRHILMYMESLLIDRALWIFSPSPFQNGASKRVAHRLYKFCQFVLLLRVSLRKNLLNTD